jgi:hypothetical protein
VLSFRRISLINLLFSMEYKINTEVLIGWEDFRKSRFCECIVPITTSYIRC